MEAERVCCFGYEADGTAERARYFGDEADGTAERACYFVAVARRSWSAWTFMPSSRMASMATTVASAA